MLPNKLFEERKLKIVKNICWTEFLCMTCRTMGISTKIAVRILQVCKPVHPNEVRIIGRDLAVYLRSYPWVVTERIRLQIQATELKCPLQGVPSSLETGRVAQSSGGELRVESLLLKVEVSHRSGFRHLFRVPSGCLLCVLFGP